MQLLEELPCKKGNKRGLFLCPVCKRKKEISYYIGLKSKRCFNCYNKEKSGANNPKYRHGETTGGYTHLYYIWADMKRRATSPNHSQARKYFLRGIDICDEWLNFKSFKNWAIRNGYRQGLTIDRIDNNKGYYPKNCRFVTNAENCRNSRRAKINVDIAKKIKTLLNEKTIVGVARQLNVSEHIVRDIKRGKTWREV